MWNLDSSYSKPVCHVVSNAFSIPKKTVAVDTLLLKFRVTWPVSLIHWSVVLWYTPQPYWQAFNGLFSSTCLWTIFRINFSNNLPIFDRMLLVLSSEGILSPYLASVRLWLERLGRMGYKPVPTSNAYSSNNLHLHVG